MDAGRTVKDRASELNTTGVPEKFNIEFFADVADARETEKKIHKILESYRHNSSREFFRIEPNEAKKIIEEHMPELTWCEDESGSEKDPVSKSAFDRLTKCYNIVFANANKFITKMKTHEYYDNSHGYDGANERKCDLLLIRLGYIKDGLDRMNTKEALESPYKKIDNAYMKKELNDIQKDIEKYKDSIYSPA